MKPLTTVLVRILALWVFVMLARTFIPALASVIYSSRGDKFVFYIYLGSAIALVLMGLVAVFFLWVRAEKVANGVIAGVPSDMKLPDISHEVLLKVAVTFLGIYLIILSLPGLLGELAYRISFSKLDEGRGYFSAQFTAEEIRGIVVNGASVLFGILLFGAGRRIVSFFRYLWDTGSFERHQDE